MTESNIWLRAKKVNIKTSPDITPGFDIGFDDEIPKDVEDELRCFVKWVENNFNIPITLWVDFEYKHYLIKRNKQRVGYIFYWADFTTYPVFENPKDIPEIRLPVRTDHYTMEEILFSFIQAITDYFAWICGEIDDDYITNDEEVEEVLNEYLDYKETL